MPTPDEVPTITDVRVVAVITHPVRRRLLAIMRLDGPATVGVLAQRTGQAVGSISHHLKVLAGAGLIEEVPELAKDRREHWWRRSTPSIRWDMGDLSDEDPAVEVLTSSVLTMNVEYQLSQLRAWDAVRSEEHSRWPTGPFSIDSWMRLTDDELAELREELVALMTKWERREVPDDGQDRRPVFVFAHGVPGEP